MMPLATATDFLDSLRSQQLLEQEQLDEISQQVLPQCADARALGETLVQKHWLTSYQMERVLERRASELVLGPYHLLELLGEGGMGQVYKALHKRLRRVVALKVIRPERLSQDPEVVRRFQREAQAAAQMFHPNVVIIYDADQIDNTHFIAMEYVEGIDLDHLVKERGPLPVAQACDFIRQAALGLQHAHERGLVHRDIKPANLLLECRVPNAECRLEDKSQASSSFGTRHSALGNLKILDMGLARLVRVETGQALSFQTQAGVVMGTPDFISPEQARNASNVDIRADLYSLGCTFYFLLTGLPPFPDVGVVEMLLMHQLDEPKPVAELRPEVPAAVAAVVHKLLAKKPAQRYQTPLEVAEALSVLAGATLAPSASSAATTSASTPLPPPADASAERTKNTSETAVVAVHAALPSSVTADKPAEGERAQQISLLKGHRGWVMALAFSSDRNLLASGGVDGQVRLWGFSSQLPPEQVLPTVHRGEVHALAFSRDNQRLASGSGALDGLVHLWELSGAGPKHRAVLTGHKAPVEAVAFSPDSQLLASASSDKTVRIWDLSGAEPREWGTLKGHEGFVHTVAFAPNGKLAASGSQDGTVRLWSLGRLWATELAVLPGHSGTVQSVAFSPDGMTLASAGSLDQTVLLWDLSQSRPRPRTVLEGHTSAVRLLLIQPDGKTLVSVENRGVLRLWDLASATQVRAWPALGVMLSSAAFTFDGRYFAAGKSDGNVAVYRLYPKRKAGPESILGPRPGEPA